MKKQEPVYSSPILIVASLPTLVYAILLLKSDRKTA